MTMKAILATRIGRATVLTSALLAGGLARTGAARTSWPEAWNVGGTLRLEAPFLGRGVEFHLTLEGGQGGDPAHGGIAVVTAGIRSERIEGEGPLTRRWSIPAPSPVAPCKTAAP